MASEENRNRFGDRGDGGDKRVQDDGDVDRKVKDRIIKAREAVDEAEEKLFIDEYGQYMSQPDHVRQSAKRALDSRWAIMVRQYLRTIRPLLRSDEIDAAEYYWKDVTLFDGKVIPQRRKDLGPGEDPIEWGWFYKSEESDSDIARAQGLDVDMAFEAPEPKHVEINGLRQILDFQGETYYWTVTLNPKAIGPEVEQITLVANFELEKSTYEMAVEYADEFLQEAGIGLELGQETKEADMDYSDIDEIDNLDSQ